MRIRSSTLEEHEFIPVRRRGYDRREVDAVIARVTATLKEYEALTVDVQTRLHEAEETAEATRRTHLAAQRTHDNMLSEARAAADETRARATREAAELLEAARAEAKRLRQDATDAHEEARRTLEAARDRAGELVVEADAALAEAKEHADDVLAKAASEAATVRADADRHATQARYAATTVTADATDAAERQVAAATSEAADLSAAARRHAESMIATALREARELRATALAESDDIRRSRVLEADRVLANARAEADAILTAAGEDTEAALAEARADARHAVDAAQADARERLAQAQRRADEILDGALAEAAAMVRRAEHDKHTVDEAAADLARRVAEAERLVHRWAAASTQRLGTIGGTLDADPTRGRYAAAGTPSDVITIVLPDGDDDHVEVVHHPTLPGLEAFAPGANPRPVGTSAHRGGSIDASGARDDAWHAAVAGLASRRGDEFAEPDGSGRPPAARSSVTAATDEHVTATIDPVVRTVYQRAGRSLRRRLRAAGQDPTQRGR